jgi:hypothetical protein
MDQPRRRRLEWRFFFGACLLTGALLVPGAGAGPVAAGCALAALVLLAWSRLS